MKSNSSTPETEEAFYGVSRDTIAEIERSLEQHDVDQVRALVSDMHAADVADLLNALAPHDRRLFLETLKDDLDPDILSSVDESIRSEVFDILGIKAIAAAVSDLESDDAFDLLNDLEEEQKQEVLRSISAGDRAFLEETLTYPEDSAGRLMQHEIVCVPPFWTVAEAIDFIRESYGLPDTFYSIFVVDPRHHPIGEVSLSTLLKQPLTLPVSDIMDTDLSLIPVTKDQEEVAVLFRHYGLVSAAVVDASDRIVGMITVDDVVDVITDEAEEDILNISRVGGESFHLPVIPTAYLRVKWLLITLVSTLFSSFVISQFEGSIQKLTMLSFLMTINAAMGGNAGMQVVTIVIRAIATGSLKEDETLKAIWKEVSVSFISGLFLSAVLGGITALWVNDSRIGLILSAALLCNMIWSAIAGTFLPIFIHRMGMDPAVGAGPILTTTTDVIGYSTFLGLATYFLM